MTLIAAVALATIATAPGNAGGKMGSTKVDWSLIGKPVDIAPWTYEYRADRKIQPQPEANFIPRRLDRIDKIYRTAKQALSPQDYKSLYYDLKDMNKPFPPAPKGKLQAGLLWVGGLADYTVELHWTGNPPPPENVEVRAYPCSFGWFGWTVDQILEGPSVSDGGRTWSFKSDPTQEMDTFYNGRVPAATQMLAVFVEGDDRAIPSLSVVGPSTGSWKRMDVEIEWGFDSKLKGGEPKLEPYMAQLGASKPLEDGSRQGVAVPVLYAPTCPPGLDSRITLWLKKDSFTVRLIDLDKGPVYLPRQGFYIAKAGPGLSAKQFVKTLRAKNLKSITQMTREHREAASYKELLQEVRLWNIPGAKLKPFPKVPEPVVAVQLPDLWWTDTWRILTNQLRGPHMWGSLAFEVGRVAHDMNMIGLSVEPDKVYDHFLATPGVKCDADYSDGAGSFETATAMRHDMGYSHDGTHPSTGRILFAMSERYFLTGDRAWFEKNRARMKAAADWIVRMRRTYMDYVPNRKDLFCAGLMPPQMLGDYALPVCDWRWYYVDNVLSLQGVRRFGQALEDFDPKEATKYLSEARAFEKDIRRAVDRDITLAPVRLGRDGAYHSYIPRMAYMRGLTGPEVGAPQFPECDKFMGGLPLAEPFAVMDASDPRMVDNLELMEEMGTSVEAVQKNVDARRAKGLPTDDAWFWTAFVILPKASHNASCYLLQDDIPNFLRYLTNTYASIVAADGRLWEPWHLGDFETCTAPDNGTAGWFMENFRDMLMMEVGPNLWIARGTPRAWLEQGKRIAVKNAPTYFGNLDYEILSDVDHGKITATVDIPSRDPAKGVVVRLRHPRAVAIKSVTVDGKPWPRFDPGKETITLTGLTGKAVVVASY